MKYIVFWLLVINVSLSNKPKIDEFGAKSQWTTLEYNMGTEYEQYFKMFDDRQAALDFLSRGQNHSKVYAIAIDSVKIPTTEEYFKNYILVYDSVNYYTLPILHDTIILRP
jgi:hypothetical protein